MDPLGFALENFDGIGEWRVKEPGGAIDPTGQLADGSARGRPGGAPKGCHEAARDCSSGRVTEKLMTYGLGRGRRAHGHAGRPRHRARRGDAELPVLVDRARAS